MANAAYPSARTWILEQALLSVTIRAVLVDLGVYTYSAAHDFLADVPEAARLATSAGLTGLVVTDGALSVAAFSFIDPVDDAASAGVVYYVDTGTEATSSVLGYQDTFTEGALAVEAGVQVNINGHNCLSIG